MRRPRRAFLAGLVLAAVATTAVFAQGTAARTGAAKPIIIGAAVDLTSNMSPFDTPALAAAQLEAKKINAKGGVDGRQLVIKVCNHQLKPEKGKACAASLVGKGAVIGLVTCDVDYAAPAATEFLNRGLLTLADCIGTDQMGPKRFGAKGKLAFTLGNVAQDEGAAMAEYSYSRGWRTAIVVKDNLLVYFRNIADSFANRFQQLGGKIVQRESFTSFDKTISNVISRISGTKADVIAFPTAFSELPTLVAGLRSLKNNTPIINSWGGDGNYWWPKNPKVTNYYYVTYASIFGNDPDPAVNKLVKALPKPPATGSFVTGAAAIDAIVAAIKKANGSTNGKALARIFEHFKGLRTISGKVSYSPALHSVFGRAYRVMLVNNNQAKFLRLWVTKKLAKI
jgi:branched-chain amino acid transport system substrate-binding protein